MSKKIVILGAGLAGLSLAYHLKDSADVYEQEEKPGGLARSERINGFTFDYSGHLLHFRTEYARNLVQGLLAGNLREQRRRAWIYLKGDHVKYPFQANTFSLPEKIASQCLRGLIKAKQNKGAQKPENFADWMRHNFGSGITKYFMYPYNKKFWTMAPENLSADWTENYVPQVRVEDLQRGSRTSRTKPLGYNSWFSYPRTGGMEQLPEAFARKIKKINLGYKVKAIDLQKKKVYFANNKSAVYTHLGMSLPLVELKELIANKLPGDVSTAFSRLEYISIYNLNLGVERTGISDRHWTYFPDKELSFFRVGFPMNFSKDLVPRGKSSLYAEVSYSKTKPRPRNIDQKILRDLCQTGILKKSDKILVSLAKDIKFGYVVYDHNYRRSVEQLEEFLLKNDVFLLGRFGRWKYMSMEDVIMDGKIVADKLRDR